MEAVTHKKGFKLLSSNSEAVGHKTSKGFSLIEAAIVLAVVGGVIGTIWVSAANMYESYKVNKTAADLQLIVKNAQKLISFRDAEAIGNTDTLASTLLAAGVYPKDWVNGNTVKNPFGGEVLATLYDGSINHYLDDIPQSACIKLVVKISSIGATAGSSGTGSTTRSTLGYVSIHNYDVGSTAWSTQTFPITTETAASQCGSLNKLNFTYGHTRIN